MTLLEIVSAGPCQSYAQVLTRLDRMRAVLPETDGLSWFTNLYLEMTTAVAERARQGAFRAPQFLETLDCIFADLYFTAVAQFLRDRNSAPGAWTPLFQARMDTWPKPLQFAVAGVNAHINRDLPVALVAAFERDGSAPSREDVRYADYLAVDSILREVHERVKTALITGVLAEADAALGRVDDTLELWSLEHARGAAWSAGELRWHLRGSAFLASQHLATLDGLVGLASRGILRPGVIFRAA